MKRNTESLSQVLTHLPLNLTILNVIIFITLGRILIGKKRTKQFLCVLSKRDEFSFWVFFFFFKSKIKKKEPGFKSKTHFSPP